MGAWNAPTKKEKQFKNNINMSKKNTTEENVISIYVNGIEFKYIPMYNVIGVENDKMNICISNVRTRKEAVTAAEWALKGGYTDFQAPNYVLQSLLTHLIKEDGECIYLDEDDYGWPTKYYVTAEYKVTKA